RSAFSRVLAGSLAAITFIALHAQAPARLEFEVAAIRRPDPDSGGGVRQGPIPQELSGRYFVRSSSLYFLIVAAYFNGGQCGNTDCPYVVGGPNWIKNDQFQIDARVAESYPLFTMRQVRDGKAPYVQQMLQALLTDRFGLKFHREPHEFSAFALTVG